MATTDRNIRRYVEAIRRSGLSLYDPIEIGDPELWIPAPALEDLLDSALKGVSLAGLPLRTRSKAVKEYVCEALGYPTPARFKRVQPRFPGQRFDIYVQKSNNVQVWNESIAPTRRYVLVRLDEKSMITRVKVVSGEVLALWDRTGTLTRKYQARILDCQASAELISKHDTELLTPFVRTGLVLPPAASPLDFPQAGQIASIREVFDRLSVLVGRRFPESGSDQERARGGVLHRLVCKRLGYRACPDDGRFPDLRHQLLEIKLQTSPVVDLGMVRPDSRDPLDLPRIEGRQLRYCDVRYALFRATTDGKSVTLTNLFVATGEQFCGRFPLLAGKVVNRKLQITLPRDFFCD